MGGSNSKLGSLHVIVVGGSFAGIATAKELERKGFIVTIIDPRDTSYVSFGSLRAVVEPGFEKRLFLPRTRVLKKAASSIRCGFASSVDPATRSLVFTPVVAGVADAGACETLSYDFLVIATGSTAAAPFAPKSLLAKESRAAFAALQADVRAANKVVIVGGGPTGIELAGEIKTDFPTTDVTLVHSGAELLTGPGNKTPPALAAKLAGVLAAKGVKILFNERVVAPVKGATPHPSMGPSIMAGPVSVQLESGAASIECVDLVFFASGSKPNTGWLRGTPLEAAIDRDSGLINVGRDYGVTLPGADVEHLGIFALGDCAHTPDAKAAWIFDKVAPIVATNCANLARNKPLKLAPAKGFSGIMLVPVGRNDGAGVLPFGLVGKRFTRTIKGKDLFTGMYAGKLGLKMTDVISTAD